MAVKQVDDGALWINGKRYTLNGSLVAKYIERFPSKISIGPDDYANEQFLSNWIIKDQRGGIGKEEMDESVDFDRSWWTNCIEDFEGHTFLPRLATEISAPSADITEPTITNADFEHASSGWTVGQGTWSQASDQKHGGTYSWKAWNVNISDNIYQSLTGYVPGVQYTFTLWIRTQQAGDTFKIGINDGVSDTWSATSQSVGTWTQFTVTKTFSVAATQCKLTFTCVAAGAGSQAWVDDAAITATNITVGTFLKFANFNSELYSVWGRIIAKLNGSRDGWTIVAYTGSTITDIIPSLNNRLYVYLGDATNYYYMSTSDVFVQSNSANANLGIQWDGKLWKINTSGATAYSTDPDGGAPTWTSDASITDIASQIEKFFIGKDADGNDVIYCATNSAFKIHDFTNTLWLDTALKLPNHPNGGKGAAYWHDGHYISYGLGMIKYVSGSTATITEVGLIKDDGLPVEYNGEIVSLSDESSLDVMFALIDASQTSGNSQSGLYAYNGRAWRCWWIDSSNNGAMHDVIVSSASSGFAVYWDCGSATYYIDIHRGIANAQQLAGTQEYEASGIKITPWFDAGTAAFKKLLKRIMDWADKITTTETVAIKYRTDKANTDRDTGWTTLETLNTTGESGENEEVLASGAGFNYNTIQYRFDLARGSTTTNSPDLQAVASSYRKLTKGNWDWTIPILIDGKWGRNKREQQEDLETAAESETDVALLFREKATTQTHYVKIFLPYSTTQTGQHYDGTYTIRALETVEV